MLYELRRHNAIVQERIMKSFGYADTEDFIQKGEDEIELIQKGEIDYDWELEKAVYADTAQNRRLNRVGQEYHRGRKKKNMDDGNDRGSSKNLGSQASKTDTSTLKKVANSDKAPQAMKDAAKKELQNRGNAGGTNSDNPKQAAIDFLTKNADKYMDYQYGDVDDETSKKFDEAMKHVKMGKIFDYGEDGAEEYKDKMEGKGYHVIDLTPGSDQTSYALIKKPKEKTAPPKNK